MNRFLSVLLLAMWVSVACSNTAPSSAENRPTPPTALPSPNLSQSPDVKLKTEIEQIASTARGRVGVSASVLETGQSVSLNSSDHFPMQSVYKLPISMAVLKQVDYGKIKLDQKLLVTKQDFIGRNAHSAIRDKYPNGIELSVSDLLRFAISESDGTASDVLMSLAGGPEAVQSYLTSLQISDMKIVDTEKAFTQDHSLQHRNWSTPDAAISLLRALQEGHVLSDASQALLLKLMVESSPGQKRLKGLLPAGTIVAHKTGTSGTENGVTAATNDIGIITLPNGNHLGIAVFVAASPADQAKRERVIAEIAKAVVEAFK